MANSPKISTGKKSDDMDCQWIQNYTQWACFPQAFFQIRRLKQLELIQGTDSV